MIEIFCLASNITHLMKVSSDRYQKEKQTGPHRRIRCTRRDRGSSRWYRSAFTREKLFFISLFRVHLNNTTSCCECAESREENTPPARPGTREFWDRPWTRSYRYEGACAKYGTIPREPIFDAILELRPPLCITRCFYTSWPYQMLFFFYKFLCSIKWENKY